MAAKKTDSGQVATRIRIKIKAYDNKVIDQSARKIVETAERSGSRITGPVPLPGTGRTTRVVETDGRG